MKGPPFMLVPLDDVAASYGKYKEKLDKILRMRAEAPPEFRVATEHFASMSWVFRTSITRPSSSGRSPRRPDLLHVSSTGARSSAR